MGNVEYISLEEGLMVLRKERGGMKIQSKILRNLPGDDTGSLLLTK